MMKMTGRTQKIWRMKIKVGQMMKRWKRRRSKKRSQESKGLKGMMKRVKKRKKRVRRLQLLYNPENSLSDQLGDRG